MKKNKKSWYLRGTSFLFAFMMFCSCNLFAFAENSIEELDACEYESVAEFKNCVTKHRSLKSHKDQKEVLLSAYEQDALYVPKYLKEHQDQFEDILVTPTYIGVGFEWKDNYVSLLYYPDKEYGKELYKIQKDLAKKGSKTNPLPKKWKECSIYEVRSSEISEFYWMQGDNTFVLQICPEEDDRNYKVNEAIKLCEAVELPLNFNKENAKAPAAKATVKKTGTAANSANTVSHTDAQVQPAVSSPKTEVQNKTEDTYVLNTNSHKFHTRACQHAKKIKAENYATCSDRAKIISWGYVPCKVCKP